MFNAEFCAPAFAGDTLEELANSVRHGDYLCVWLAGARDEASAGIWVFYGAWPLHDDFSVGTGDHCWTGAGRRAPPSIPRDAIYDHGSHRGAYAV